MTIYPYAYFIRHTTDSHPWFSSVQFSSVQFSSRWYLDGKAHMRSTLSFKGFPNVAFETVPIFV